MNVIELTAFLTLCVLAYGIAQAMAWATGITWGWWVVPVFFAEFFGIRLLVEHLDRKDEARTESRAREEE